MPIGDEIRAFLDRELPGSTLEDGYFFVVIDAAARRDVRGGCCQPLADDLCRGRCWLVVVGGDPRAHAPGFVRAEERQVTYSPDWDRSEPMAQWLVEVVGTPVDLAAIAAASRPEGVVALIAPERGLVLTIGVLDIHAAAPDELDRLVAAHPDCFVA
jgi:hypothetical protein